MLFVEKGYLLFNLLIRFFENQIVSEHFAYENCRFFKLTCTKYLKLTGHNLLSFIPRNLTHSD